MELLKLKSVEFQRYRILILDLIARGFNKIKTVRKRMFYGNEESTPNLLGIYN